MQVTIPYFAHAEKDKAYKRAIKKLYAAANDQRHPWELQRKIVKKVNWLEAHRKEVLMAVPERIRAAHRSWLRMSLDIQFKNLRKVHEKAFTINTEKLW